MEKEKDWARTIRARNLRELAAGAVLAAAVLYLHGFSLRVVPLLAAIVFEAWFFLCCANWQAKSEDGGVGVRRELIRQGHLLRGAWAWYVVPILVGGLTAFGRGSWVVTAAGLGFGAAVAAVNYKAGQRLIDEGNR